MTPRRRQVLHLCGLAGIGSIAGCSISGQGDGTPTPTERRVPGIQLARLHPEDGDGVSSFGRSAAMSSDGSTALVGSPGDDGPGGHKASAAYVFEADGDDWRQRTKLAPGDGDEDFGRSVALSEDGTTAVVGAPLDDEPNGDMAGSVYVFEASDGEWSERAKVVPDDGDSEDAFGWSVDVSADGTTALLGAHGEEDPNGGLAGAAYSFSSGTFVR